MVIERGEDVEARGGFDELGEVIKEGEIVQGKSGLEGGG